MRGLTHRLVTASRRGVGLRIPGRAVLGASAFLLGWAGSRGEWISFPLSAGSKGAEMAWPWSIPFPVTAIPMSAFFVVLLLLGCALWLLSARAGLCTAALALGGMLSVPFAAGAARPEWIGRYVRESFERAELESFVRRYLGSNVTSEPTYLPLLRLDGAEDQLSAGFAMLGAGWMLATVAVVVLVGLMVRRGNAQGDLALAGAVTAGFVVLLAGPSVFRVLDAQALVARADRGMLAGRVGEARALYGDALERNPALVHAVPFLMRAAETWSGVGGSGGAPYRMRGAWLASARSSRGASGGSARVATLRAHREDLFALLESPPGESRLEEALHDWGRTLYGWLWMREGLSLLEAQALAPAAHAFELGGRFSPSLVAPFFQAKAYMAMGDGEKAVRVLEPLTETIGHGSMLADVHCALGDAQTHRDALAEARAAYRMCRELDQKDNFWVLRALSGT